MAADSGPRELTMSSYLGALTHYWWVIVGLVVVGILAGAVYTLTLPTTYDATASVYIGQTTDANGNPMAGLNSNSKAATQLLASDLVLQQAAKTVGEGVTASKLRRTTSVSTPSQTIKTTTSVVNIVVITVTDTKPVRAAASANALASALLSHLGDTTAQKITLLQTQAADLQTQLDQSKQISRRADAAIAAIAKGGGTAADKAAASAPYVAAAQAAATDQDSLETALQRTQLLLLTAKNVEQPRLLHEAVPPQSASGPDMRLNVAAGALAGFVIGVVAAFVLERRRLVAA